MKEQVKEWIVDKNLTTDSFDSIMIGVIYNSGHSTLDDPDVRKWIETHPDEFRLMLPPKLTVDQQVVLDYLKSRYHDRAFPFDLVGGLNSRFFSGPDWETDEVLKAYGGLNSRQQFQVLAAFAEWGMEQEEE